MNTPFSQPNLSAYIREGSNATLNQITFPDGTSMTSAPAASLTPAYVSVTLTQDITSSTTSVNPFATFLGGAPTTNASQVSYVDSSGNFYVSGAGIYEITCVLHMEITSSDYVQVYLNENNGTVIWEAETRIHSSVDPVERTVTGIFQFAASDSIAINISGPQTRKYMKGTTMNINKIADYP